MFFLTKLSSNLAQLAHSKKFHGVCALFAIALIGVALMASPPQPPDFMQQTQLIERQSIRRHL